MTRTCTQVIITLLGLTIEVLRLEAELSQVLIKLLFI